VLLAALIGCGRIGARDSSTITFAVPPGWLPLSHAEAMRSCPDLELRAACDIDSQRLRDAADRHSIPQRFADFRELLADVRPAVIGIATRTESRPQIIMSALQHGVRGMHIEKPLARSMDQTDTLLDALRVSRTAVTYGTTRRYMGLFANARRQIDQGAIGRVTGVTVDFDATTLMWNHPHSVDLLLFLSGRCDVARVKAECSVTATSNACVEDDPVLIGAEVTFGDGVIGTITNKPGRLVKVMGTEGSLAIHGDGAELTLSSADGSVKERVAPQRDAPSGTEIAFRHLAMQVKDDRPSALVLDAIRAGQQVLFASVYSAMTGREVDPADVPGDLTVLGRTGANYA